MSKKERLQAYLKKLKATGNIEEIPSIGLSKSDRKLLEKILEENLVDESLELIEGLDVEKDWAKLQSRFPTKKVKRLPTASVLKYAAIFVGALVLGLALKWTLYPGKNNALPNGNIITLHTGDGVKPILENKKQAIALTSGEVVAVQEGSTLRYDPGAADQPVFNELHIPHGKMFTLILSDGTEIQLNSGTHIRYPVKFPKEGNREVTMTGEAYFKVSKDKDHPFIVNSHDMAIQVLGTEFNIAAYEEENTVNTVLVEGSVSLSHASAPENKVLLEPGNKGSWNSDQKAITVEKVDTELHTSWLNGEIVFRDTPFSELLIKLERAYDVNIKNNNAKLVDKAFNARYNRKVERIEDVLEALRVIVPFDYEIKKENNENTKLIIIE